MAPNRLRWNDPQLRIRSDSRRTARYRALQSWYRETVLEVPPGHDRRGRLIASMLPEEEVALRPGLNFVSPEASTYAGRRADEVLRSGGTLEEDRLRRNMLSSMPLCFNIIGALRDQAEFPSLMSELFDVDAREIEVAECEWAPDRATHLNDRTAFDAFLIYRDASHRRCFLAIETKYTEPFSQKEYDSAVYQEVTSRSGYFKAGAGERLVKRNTNQLWRMTMLAVSMLRGDEFDAGAVAVLCLADDHHADNAVTGVRGDLLAEDLVKLAALEALAEAADRRRPLSPWVANFQRRYLDLSPVLA